MTRRILSMSAKFGIGILLLIGIAVILLKMPFKTGEWPTEKENYRIIAYGVPQNLLGVCDLQLRVYGQSNAEVARVTLFSGIDTREECKTGELAIKNIKTDRQLTKISIEVESGVFEVPVETGRFQVSEYIK